MCEDEEFDEMEDVLIFDEEAEEVWNGIFDVTSAQEITDIFDKPVLVERTGRIYRKED